MKDKCRGFMGRLRCNFEARYDRDNTLTPDHIRELVDLAVVAGTAEINNGKTTYVCDVCTACGEQRTRPTVTDWMTE